MSQRGAMSLGRMECGRCTARTAWACLGIAAAAGVAIAVPFWGSRRWRSRTKELLNWLEAARAPNHPGTVSFDDLEGLPTPVQRYFRTALTDGQRLVSAVTVSHTGTFNASECCDCWRRFRSAQRVVTRRPGFLWDGRISMLPGVPVNVHDAYIAGEGILRPALFGLLPLANQHDVGGDVAQGELLRFLAEAAWYPTALLPSQGVRWDPVDEQSATATLADGALRVSMTFRFGDDGLIRSGRAEARGRTIGGRMVPTPWEGVWSSYAVRNGMSVPLRGEAAWLLPEGRRPYWRGRIEEIDHELG